ncbi:hypothetical protein AHAS_Ahas20G0129400 [Arachis hypogaea]
MVRISGCLFLCGEEGSDRSDGGTGNVVNGGAGLIGSTALLTGRADAGEERGDANWRVVGTREIEGSHNATVGDELTTVDGLSRGSVAAKMYRKEDGNHGQMETAQETLSDQSRGRRADGHAGVASGDAGFGQDDCGTEDRESETQGFEEQMTENKLTLELAMESGAVVYDDKADIMAILQAQNDKLGQKRKMAKQKAKMRRCRPKHKKVNTKDRLSRFRIINQDDKRCVLCNRDAEQTMIFSRIVEGPLPKLDRRTA